MGEIYIRYTLKIHDLDIHLSFVGTFRKMGGTMMKQMKSHVNITQPKKRLCMFQNINKGWTPTVHMCLSVFQCHLFGATLRITCTLAILLGFPWFLDTSTRVLLADAPFFTMVLLADAPSFSDAIFVVPPPQGEPLPVISRFVTPINGLINV